MKRIVRRFVAIVLTVTLTFCMMCISPIAASADIAVRVSKTECMQDDEITVEVYFPKSYNKIASLDMTMPYDTQKLEVVKVSQGKGLKTARDKQTNGEVFSENHSTAGEIRWCLTGGNNYQFSGVFAEIVFKIKSLANHGKCELGLKVNEAVNSGFVDMADSVSVSGASFNISRNTVNDLMFKLNSDETGYLVTEYLCMDYDTVVIPSEYKGLPVVGIEYAAFMNHAEIVNLTLPSTLEYIGRDSFNGCSGIKEVNIPVGVIEIEDSAFERCSGIEKLSLPIGLESVGMSAFKNCIRITDVDLPFTLKKLDANAFRDCYTLANVKISKNTQIGKNAFASCDDNLKFITVDGNSNLTSYIGSSGISPKIEYVKDLSHGTVAPISACQYTGSEITPEAKITLNSGEKVELNKDYKVVYRKNKDIGTAVMYVGGINDYGEGYIKTFKIKCSHEDTVKIITTEPTCLLKGRCTYTCKTCGYKTYGTVPATGHVTTDEWTISKRPTITTTGSKYQLCTKCRFMVNITTIPKAYPDVNSDGKINSADALIVLQQAVGTVDAIKPGDQFMNADTNGDGHINSTDALTILKISVGMITL